MKNFNKEDLSFSLAAPVFLALYLFFSMISITLSQIFLFLALVAWIVLLLLKKERLRFPAFFWPLLAYSGLSLISSFFSFNVGISLKDCRELLLFLVVPITYAVVANQKELKKINLAFLASAYVSCFYSLFYFLFRAQPGERIAGFAGHYMTQAGMLLLFCAMALSLFFFLKDRTRFLWGAGFVFGVFMITLTLTRSSWVGLAAAVIVILFFYRPVSLVVFPVVLGLFFFLAPKNIKDRALSIFDLKNMTNRMRIEYIKAGLGIIKDYPLLGTGPDMALEVFQNPKYGLSEEAKRNVHLHNNILQIGAERGLFALGAWLVFIVWVFLSLFRLLRNKDPTLRAFTVGALAVTTALFMAGLFEYNFADSEITALFLYIITLPFVLAKTDQIKT
jgi:O-antigen ligase